MNHTESLEWKLKKLGESVDMLNHALYLRRNKRLFDLVGRSQRPWCYRDR